MTNTFRATSNKAVNHDRSENKTGLDPSLKKGGAGSHNWGSVNDELDVTAAEGDDPIARQQDENPPAGGENGVPAGVKVDQHQGVGTDGAAGAAGADSGVKEVEIGRDAPTAKVA